MGTLSLKANILTIRILFTSHLHKTTILATQRNQVHTYSMSQRTADTGVKNQPYQLT